LKGEASEVSRRALFLFGFRMIVDPVRAKQDESVSIQAARMLGDAFMELFDDPAVTELYVNPGGRLWVSRLGQGRCETPHVLQPVSIESFLNLMATHLGETLGRQQPRLQGEMPVTRFRKARLQGYLPPRAPAPGFNIRKHATAVFPLESYVDRGALSIDQYDLLVQAVDERANILVAGGTASGKTTFLNALILKMSERSPRDRFIIIEDTGELQCMAPDVAFLRPLPGESMGSVVKEVLRLSPDRLFCGEFRDEAAYHCCDLWSTGHPGGAATTHAETVDGALNRMNRLALGGKDGSYADLVADAVDVVVILQKAKVGGKVVDFAFVDGLDERGRYNLERPVLGANQ
jgi:type IV secretion system protein VirB11